MIGWDVRELLYLVCNSERVLAKTRDAIVVGLRAQLAQLSDG